MESIAYQCIYEGGPGVIISRNILFALDTSYVFNDEYLCETERFANYHNNSFKSNKTKLHLFPNPANESIIVRSNHELKDLINLSVYDVTGREMTGFSYKVKDLFCFINTSSIQPGVYTLLLNFKDQIQALKFVIAR